MSRLWAGAFIVAIVSLTAASAQQPQPFPRPADRNRQGQPPPEPTPPTESAPVPEDRAPVSRDLPPPEPRTPRPVSPNAALANTQPPSEADLGAPLYPAATFVASYDAGRGQRYYLFGATASYAEVVQYYRRVLRDGGDRVFEEPPVHTFEIGRFRESSMAFPPSVTVKDYTWGGSRGYLNPVPGASPDRFPTIIQIVPSPRP